VGAARPPEGRRGGRGHPGLDTSDDIETVRVAPFEGAPGVGLRGVREQVVVAEGEVEFRAEEHARSAEVLRGDADDGERTSVDADGLAD
jgi:hypothetical protein